MTKWELILKFSADAREWAALLAPYILPAVISGLLGLHMKRPSYMEKKPDDKPPVG